MRILRSVVGAVVVAAAVGLGGCSAPSASPSPADTAAGGGVIAPVTMAANDLQGTTVELVVGQVLNITTGDLAVDSYAGEVADTSVATFVAGHDDGSAQFDPGVEAVGVGETIVTMTNEDGGIQPLEFTVVVTER